MRDGLNRILLENTVQNGRVVGQRNDAGTGSVGIAWDASTQQAIVTGRAGSEFRYTFPDVPTPQGGAVTTEEEKVAGSWQVATLVHDHWGRRELAYPIEKQTTGNYHLVMFTADNTFVVEADRDLRLEEKVLRHLIVVDEEWAEQNRKSQAKRGKLSNENSEEA